MLTSIYYNNKGRGSKEIKHPLNKNLLPNCIFIATASLEGFQGI